MNAWQQLEGVRVYKSTLHCQTDKEDFNALSCRLQIIKGVKTYMLTEQVGRWFKDITNSPKIDNYGAPVNAKINSITKQNKRFGDPIHVVAMWILAEAKCI